MGHLCSVTVLTSDPIKGLEIQPLQKIKACIASAASCRPPQQPPHLMPKGPVSSSQAQPEPSEPTGIFQTSPCLPTSPNL